MKLDKLSKGKGVAGLNVYLSLISMLFMIGIIVMVFQIAGSKLASSLRTSTSGTTNLESGFLNGSGYTLAQSTINGFSSPSIVAIVNATSLQLLPATNYTLVGNILYNASAVNYNTIKINYTYIYSAENDASQTINDTANSIKTSTDFFPTFIVLGAMVVLILLVVIIINSIRATGVTGEGA